jgi:ureidoglycolate hydrolase
VLEETLMEKIRTVALTPENVAPYGSMITRKSRGPSNPGGDFTWFGEIDAMQNFVTQFNLCAMKRHDFLLSQMELHENTKEALVVLDSEGILLALAPKGEFDQSKVLSFFIPRGEGIVFDKGTYHSTPYPVADETTMLIVFEADTGRKDLRLIELSQAMEIEP